MFECRCRRKIGVDIDVGVGAEGGTKENAKRPICQSLLQWAIPWAMPLVRGQSHLIVVYSAQFTLYAEGKGGREGGKEGRKEGRMEGSSSNLCQND